MKNFARAVVAVLCLVACGSGIEGDQLSSGGGGFAAGGTQSGGSSNGENPSPSDPNPNNSNSMCGADGGMVCTSGDCCGGVCCAFGQMCCNNACIMPTVDRPNCL